MVVNLLMDISHAARDGNVNMRATFAPICSSLTWFVTVLMKQQRTCLAKIFDSADLGRRNVIVTLAAFNCNVIKENTIIRGRPQVFFHYFPTKQN